LPANERLTRSAPTRLAALVETSRRVSEDASRRAKIAHLADFLRDLAPDEIELGVSWLSGVTRQGKSGIGWALLRDARPAANALTPALTLADVDATLDRIAAATGPGSAKARHATLHDLLARATADEADFLARLLIGELRQGALEGLMVDAVAAAAGASADVVRRAAMARGGIASVAARAIADGEAGLEQYRIALFQPLSPMLAQPADDIEDAMSRIGGVAAVEWKLDGARVQVHKQHQDVRIYSRTGNDVTAAAPEIAAAVQRADARSLILDGEAIALNATGAPYPFQETMSRFGRVLDIEAMRAKLPLSVFFFDCLVRDGNDLAARPASVRYEALAAAVPEQVLMPRLLTGDIAAATAFYDDAVGRGHEGVMVKAPEAPYDPGARSAAWLKVKRSHTLDLVVLAAEWGHGRRRGKLSNLHLGAIDPASGQYVMLGKTFKGMTDAMLAWQTEELLKRATSRDEWAVYVRPELVVEITFNDIQKSPRYPGGFALRFARVKGYRPDKDRATADTMDAVRAIYAQQQR
jgi:DNA ligase-1